MKPLLMAVVLPVVLALSAVCAWAQPVISAKSGVIDYVEGKVMLGDQELEYSVTKFPDMKDNQVLKTEDGRAEVLLTPGVVLRLGENSSLKLLTNRLVDTRLELLSGSAVVEADDIAKDTNVTIVCKDGTAALAKAGLFRFDAEPGRIKVFKGLADVEIGGHSVPVGAGRMLELSSASASVQKFNAEETDALDRWSHRRGEYLAMANVSAAKSLLNSGTYSGGIGGLGMGVGIGNCLNSWAFNQWYGMYTYMPCHPIYSPYGYRFWSPYTVMRAYYVPPSYYPGRNNTGFNGGGGYSYPTAGATSTGYSGVMSSAGSSGVGSSGGGVSAGGGGVSSAGGAAGGGHGGSSGGGGGGHH